MKAKLKIKEIKQKSRSLCDNLENGVDYFEEAKKLEENPLVNSVTKNLDPAGEFRKDVFPHHPSYPWSQDNFGPIYIPEKGATVAINSPKNSSRCSFPISC